MKTYVLTLSKVFPSTHARAGQLTDFKTAFNNAILCAKCQEKPKGMCMGECIIGFRKIHTIRANYSLWAKRFEKIAAGEASLSVREWMGAPYRSKQREIARLTKDDGIGLQQLTCLETNAYCFYPCERIENRDIDKVLVATNDGLSLDDWKEWFKNYDHRKPLAIIHFTKFRY